MKTRLAGAALVGLMTFGASSAVFFAAAGALSAQVLATRSVWDGVFTAEQAARGQAVYAEYCLECHGKALTGGDGTTPLTGIPFVGQWNGLTVGDLFERVRMMPPLDPTVLTGQQNRDVMAFVLSYNGMPSGSAELPTRLQLLKQIRISFEPPPGRPSAVDPHAEVR
jgi:mono/diheme cytochrome c family protein